MKGLRFLLLGMAICLASGVKAQFYDSADDIYYYVEECYEYEDTYLEPTPHIGLQRYKSGKIKKKVPEKGEERVMIFNFDGEKAALLRQGQVPLVKSELKESPTYYEDKVETTDYIWEFESSSYKGTIYKRPNSDFNYTFSSDRSTLIEEKYTETADGPQRLWTTFRRVDKSFFKVGRSRTPSGTMHE